MNTAVELLNTVVGYAEERLRSSLFRLIIGEVVGFFPSRQVGTPGMVQRLASSALEGWKLGQLYSPSTWKRTYQSAETYHILALIGSRNHGIGAPVVSSEPVVIVILITSVSSLVTVVAPILGIVGWESMERVVNEGIGPRMDERLPGSALRSSYCSVVRVIYWSMGIVDMHST